MNLLFKIKKKIRALYLSRIYKTSFISLGRNLKIYGKKNILFQGKISIGDNCWIETIQKYREFNYKPKMIIGNEVMMSDGVHLSCVKKIVIGSQTLIGSNVYIGDHSHGSSQLDKIDLSVPPYQRELGDISDIYIGERVWICNGAVILAGTYISDGCIVGANAVVKGEFKRPCVIAGIPAKNVKNLYL
ncbi:acyltransferase [Xenorhabdus bovienii]|uniref:acyltransferase n=1 Tax=Xenorhabdus bovienii TaxID=40576 RepID=UPI0023B22C3D|nr:acyltransferase [Xenorhabdus bovienii]MDE9550831.1 acyltransferase [Xenorhabdus bovienii]